MWSSRCLSSALAGVARNELKYQTQCKHTWSTRHLWSMLVGSAKWEPKHQTQCRHHPRSTRCWRSALIGTAEIELNVSWSNPTNRCTLGTSWEYSVICKITKCIVLLQQASLASYSCITSHMAFPPGSNTFYPHKPSVGDLFAFYFRVRKRNCRIWQQFERKVAVRAGWWVLIRISVFVQVISCLLVP